MSVWVKSSVEEGSIPLRNIIQVVTNQTSEMTYNLLHCKCQFESDHEIEIRWLTLIAAEPNWNRVNARSNDIINWQGWINDSVITIAEIPYFCLNHTKFVFNILINILIIYMIFVHNLRANICPTTNHYCCCTRCYWSKTASASFEISITRPCIIFIFCNDWRRSRSIVTSNEKRSLIRGWNSVRSITP